MGLLPSIDIGLDIKATVQEFVGLLRDISAKLDTLIELQRAELDEEGPALTLVPAEDVEDDLDDTEVLCGRPIGAGVCEQIMAHPGRCR